MRGKGPYDTYKGMDEKSQKRVLPEEYCGENCYGYRRAHDCYHHLLCQQCVYYSAETAGSYYFYLGKEGSGDGTGEDGYVFSGSGK